MKCTNCGSEIAANQAFCSKCGAPVSSVKNQNLGGKKDFNNPPPPPPPKKGGVPVWAFIITILIIVAIMLGVYFLVLRDSDDSDTSSKSSSSRKKDDDEDENNTSNRSSANEVINRTSGNNTTNTTNTTNTITTPTSGATSSYKVNIGDFSIKIPDNLVYQVGTDSVAIGDEGGNWVAHVSVHETPFTSVVQAKDSLASQFREKGINVTKVEEQTINGIQCLVYETSMSGENFLLAYIRVNSMYTVATDIENIDYTKYDYDALNSIISIASTAEKNAQSATTTNLETNSKIDMTPPKEN